MPAISIDPRGIPELMGFGRIPISVYPIYMYIYTHILYTLYYHTWALLIFMWHFGALEVSGPGSWAHIEPTFVGGDAEAKGRINYTRDPKKGP